ncbi:GntR family transcriptional regulator [Streptomyces lavendulae]|uniref:GntR family transcriptional regulator n=1 Tax=Streptomyces lavendulae TaxID=1914 RepID=UPI002556505F|nr:GntR family transcriptional regulator [Streptomyces lavendulae]
MAEEIIERIKSGELQPGDQIPSARKIVETKGISSATAARVLGYLRDEGWADTTPGRPTVVREQARMIPGADRLAMLRGGGDGLNDGEEVEFVTARIEGATQEVADALGVEAGSEVALRRRLYRDSAGVSVVSTTWITGALATELPEFVQPERLPKMTFGLIKDRTGRRTARQRDAYSVRQAPEDIARLLEVHPGTDVLTVANCYWDQDDEPTQYAVDYHHPHRELIKEAVVE